MITNLDNFSKHLETITLNEWNTLFSLIPEIEHTEVFGTLEGGKELEDGSYSFPYWAESGIVIKVDKAINRLDILPVYDWMKWDEGRALLSSDIDFKSLDIITICKLLTAIYRLDRFSDGNVINTFKEGIMLRLLMALQYHVENNNFPREKSWIKKLLDKLVIYKNSKSRK